MMTEIFGDMRPTFRGTKAFTIASTLARLIASSHRKDCFECRRLRCYAMVSARRQMSARELQMICGRDSILSRRAIPLDRRSGEGAFRMTAFGRRDAQTVIAGGGRAAPP